MYEVPWTARGQGSHFSDFFLDVTPLGVLAALIGGSGECIKRLPRPPIAGHSRKGGDCPRVGSKVVLGGGSVDLGGSVWGRKPRSLERISAARSKSQTESLEKGFVEFGVSRLVGPWGWKGRKDFFETFWLRAPRLPSQVDGAPSLPCYVVSWDHVFSLEITLGLSCFLCFVARCFLSFPNLVAQDVMQGVCRMAALSEVNLYSKSLLKGRRQKAMNCTPFVVHPLSRQLDCVMVDHIYAGISASVVIWKLCETRSEWSLARAH